MWIIYTKSRSDKRKEEMLSGFKTAAEAMVWLTNTYQPNAEFWDSISEFIIIYEP